jgi:hypothetical protein
VVDVFEGRRIAATSAPHARLVNPTKNNETSKSTDFMPEETRENLRGRKTNPTASDRDE